MMSSLSRVEAGWNTSTVALRVVERDISGPHKYRDLVLHVWGLGARLTALLCKRNTVAKFKEVITGCNTTNPLRKAVAQMMTMTMTMSSFSF
jgi:hypothetical protein